MDHLVSVRNIGMKNESGGIKKTMIIRAPTRVKYPSITEMLPASSRKMAPNRKKGV